MNITTKDIQTQAKNAFSGLDLSEQTKADYQYRIPAFIAFAEAEGWHNNTFLNYKKSLAQRGDITVATKNKFLSAARVLCKELHRLGVFPIDITANVKSFLQSRKHKVEGLTESEVKRLADYLRLLMPTPTNSRKKALFALLTYQGLRQIEIVRLGVGDIHFASGIMMVQGKGQVDKEPVLMAPQTIAALKEYIAVAKVGDGALFKSLSNRKAERMSTMTIKREMGELMSLLGIDKTTHGFRHFYTTMVLGELQVRDARKFTRHNSLDMLMIYDDETDIRAKSSQVFNLFNGLQVA